MKRHKVERMSESWWVLNFYSSIWGSYYAFPSPAAARSWKRGKELQKTGGSRCRLQRVLTIGELFELEPGHCINDEEFEEMTSLGVKVVRPLALGEPEPEDRSGDLVVTSRL